LSYSEAKGGVELTIDTQSESCRNAVLAVAAEMLQSSTGSNNIFLSPLSLYLALALTANMSSGDTLLELESALGMPLNELNQYCYYLVQAQLNDREETEALIAYSIWLNNNYEIIPTAAFLETNALYYDADIYRDDFASSRAVRNINNWTEKKTKGLIKKLVEELSPEKVFVLINTIYFEAQWAYKNYSTAKYEFYNADASTVNKPYLYSKTSGLYYTDSAKAFRVNLDDEYYFMGILPNDNNIDAYLSEFDQEEMISLLDNCHNDYDVNWRIPEFKYSYEENLVETVKNMAINKAFGQSADFSALTGYNNDIFIDDILQKTVIDLDKEGIRAAAATVIYGAMSSAPQNSCDIYLNRPFVYAIMDGRTDVPIFVGVVRNL